MANPERFPPQQLGEPGAWGRAPAPPPRSLLAIPEEMQSANLPDPSSQTLDILKQEMLGLTQTVKSLATQLSKNNNSKSSKMADSVGQNETPSATPPGVTKTQSNPGKQARVQYNPGMTVTTSCSQPTGKQKSSQGGQKRVVSVPVSVNLDLLEPDSEIDTPVEESSSEEEVKEVESGGSSDEDMPLEVDEGQLDWPSMVSQICDKFPEQIGPEEHSPITSRIQNLGGMTTSKTSERTKLPMYGAVEYELKLMSKDIRTPRVKARSKRDTKPLGRGDFPVSERGPGLPVQALSSHLRFNHPAQVDTEVDRLLPSGKSSYSIHGRFTEENLRQMERDLRVNLSSLSYVLWALEFTSNQLKELQEDSEEAELLQPARSAVTHAMSFLTTVVDRSTTTLSTTILARRDSYLAQMDPLLAQEHRVSLRAASMLGTRLFDGVAASMVPALDSLRKDSQERRSVNALASLAQKGVEKSQATSSSAGHSKQKRKHKKEKSSYKKGGAKGNPPKTTSEEASSGTSGKRTFRTKGKKGKKQ